MVRLTKRVVEAAQPGAKQYTLWCSELGGFGVKINTAGTRSYFVDYRTAIGVRRRMVLGRHGFITTDEARNRAIEKLAEVIRGQDPQETRRTRRKSLTVAELCDQYLVAAERGLIMGRGGLPKKGSTLAIDRGRIEQHIKPLLGDLRVIDVTRADVAGFIRDVTARKTAKLEGSAKLRGRIRVTGGPGAASRTSGLLGGLLSYAVSEGMIELNPAAGVRRPAGKRRERRLAPGEYAALGTALRQAAEAEQSWRGPAMIRLVALTGFRIGEIEGLRRSMLDAEHQTVVLGDTKTGRSVRPIGASALEAIKDVPNNGSDYLFPAPRLADRPFAGIKRFYRSLFARAGLSDVTPHILRHSFASVAADLGFADSTIGACLGHAGRGTTSRYTHILDSVLVTAADKISKEISSLLGSEVRPSRASKVRSSHDTTS